MRWNQYDKDPVKASALGEILLGVAQAGGPLDEAKLSVVYGQVAKAFGASTLPLEVVMHMRNFDGASFDLEAACGELGLRGEREQVDLMKAVALVIRSDGYLSRSARAFGLRLASRLGMSWGRALELIGPPLRPITRPRPRPVTRPY